MELFIVLGLLATAYAMVSAKRVSTLIGNFRLQALFLCILTLIEATKGNHPGLYSVSILIFAIKVIIIPLILFRISEEIKVNENLGFFIPPLLSLIIALILTYFSWVLAGMVFTGQETMLKIFGTVSFSMMFLGFFIMIFRMKALAQVIGLLAMENGIFLLASASSGGMPFLVEIAVFFDVFIGVIILGLFVYRINQLFTSIDVSKLNRLKG
ncbi:MAG: hypothetical protein NT099_04775 [Candidatus Saganbacteria bacterium]|nr:hypothetical protein [Candidatus Saganbacteria bacterium]